MVSYNIHSIARPICSRCKKIKKESELNGVDILRKRDDPTRYQNAYCRDIVHCDSKEAHDCITEVMKHLEE